MFWKDLDTIQVSSAKPNKELNEINGGGNQKGRVKKDILKAN